VWGSLSGCEGVLRPAFKNGPSEASPGFLPSQAAEATLSRYNRALASISIVIPAYNEEQRLPATLDAVFGYLAARSCWSSAEVLVVDDGSSDDTRGVVKRYPSAGVNLRLLENPGNRGKGFSVRHGRSKAVGDWVLFTDADLSAPIEELDKLYESSQRDAAEIAIGSRALDRSLIGVHQSSFREYAGRFFNLCMKVLTGLPFWDTQCGFKLFTRKAASEIFRRQRIDGFGFDPEVLFIGRKHGFRTIEVPVRWNHAEGTKVSMFTDSANMFLDLIRVRWSDMLGRYR